MTKGLTGAGLNALLQKELGKIKDKEVHKIASAAIGYLAGGQTGAAPDALLKKTGKVKGMDSHKMASAAIGYLAGGKIGTCISFWR